MQKTNNKNRKKICIVAVAPFVLHWFMSPHIFLLREKYDITLITNGSIDDLGAFVNENVSFIAVDIERKISFIKDILALIKLWYIFINNNFSCVHSMGPKAGLLTMIAGKFSGVPNRFHFFTGQVWATKTGVKRWFLMSLDKLLVYCSTRVLADSHSQRIFLIENRVVNTSKIEVLGNGSAAGVNINRFKFDVDKSNKVRSDMNIPDRAIVFLFLGRLTRDKGLMDLSKSFEYAASCNDNLHLLIVGPDEDGIDQEFVALEHKIPGKIHRAGFTKCPEDYMSASDVFCLPSYREGFGSAVIEAAAIGIPTIASNIYGVSDAIEDGITGVLHEPGNVAEISAAILMLAGNERTREEMGRAAKKRVILNFTEDIVANAMLDFYKENFN